MFVAVSVSVQNFSLYSFILREYKMLEQMDSLPLPAFKASTADKLLCRVHIALEIFREGPSTNFF